MRRERLGEKFSRDGFGRALLYWVYWDGGGESADDRLNGHGREYRLAGDEGRLGVEKGVSKLFAERERRWVGKQGVLDGRMSRMRTENRACTSL